MILRDGYILMKDSILFDGDGFMFIGYAGELIDYVIKPIIC